MSPYKVLPMSDYTDLLPLGVAGHHTRVSLHARLDAVRKHFLAESARRYKKCAKARRALYSGAPEPLSGAKRCLHAKNGLKMA